METLLKLLHIALISIWIAGALYLPQLFHQHCRAPDEPGSERYIDFARALYFRIMTPSAILAIVLGNVLIFFGFEGGWLPAKLALVLLLVLFHLYCGRVVLKFEKGEAHHFAAYYGWLSTVPIPLLAGIVALAVAKPF